MTVKELKKALEGVDDNLPVLLHDEFVAITTLTDEARVAPETAMYRRSFMLFAGKEMG